MDYKDIKKLIDDMGNSNLDSLEIEFPEGIKISMTKNTGKKSSNCTKRTPYNRRKCTYDTSCTKRR